MKRFVLISCVSKKLQHRAKAKDMYISSWFKKSMNYAKTLGPDEIFILSAKYGLLELEQEIEPYNKTLRSMNSLERKTWASKVLNELSKVVNLKRDEIIFLAGKYYRQYLIPYITHYKIPLEKLGIGKQLKYLKEKNG